ncbi:cell cycle checkpoint protein rad1 [Moniliophthora roreri MCA 2997]|uniref:Cell cycle checkpoint protein rad1 n=1 Tax=Moniliophthora roreri (strain MCA 2997) TaxID=1381753 RepID=V2X651_MONRO|nr:cell cycle checkpoint protein rad1 [Moniliophthora roreri MCA 2997]
MSDANDQATPVLKASVHDVRHFTSLLRGVNFANRATVTVTEKGLVIIVEEARTLLGTAYVFSDVFDEYEYHSEHEQSQAPKDDEEESREEQEVYNAAFEIPLNTLIECLNIFGTAGGSGSSSGGKALQWKPPGQEADGSGDEADGEGRKTNNTLDHFFGRSERRTSMRMTYMGTGHPLTLLIAEDASGPTTTCEIATFEAEPHLELPFDSENTKLKIILKSSWLKEALSEIDSFCDKLTFFGNPPEENNTDGMTTKQKRQANLKRPIFRIQAIGTLGTTEMDYYNDRDVLETFECPGPVSFSYRLAHIMRAMRALQTSIKASLRIDQEGLLSLQFLMPAQPSRRNGAVTGSTNFIEFRCLALDEEV